MFSTLSHWWQRQLRAGRASRPPGARRAAFRPRLEALEDRRVPATWFVNSAGDNVLVAGTLRYAVAHAMNGDVIDILPAAPGVGQHVVLTHGELYLNHSVTIQALGPMATIDAHHFSRVFEVAPHTQVRLLNLNIIDGIGVAHNPLGNIALDGAGGGILNEGVLIVSSCRVSFDSAKAGGGIYNEAGTLAVTGSTLAHDSTSGAGGGIFNDRGWVAVAGSTLFFDSARVGGGIATNLGWVRVATSNLSGNTATLDGGALSNVGGTMTVFADVLQGNSAGRFGGGIFNERGQLAVGDSSLIKNAAGLAGGGIANLGGAVTVTRSNVSFNHALIGGGIYNNPVGTLKVGTSLFNANLPDHIKGLYTDLGGNTFI